LLQRLRFQVKALQLLIASTASCLLHASACFSACTLCRGLGKEQKLQGMHAGIIQDGGGAPTGTPLADPPLVEAISEDPVLRNTKLIAEAWDCDGLFQAAPAPHLLSSSMPTQSTELVSLN
jgi:hypothetical protein